MATGVQPWLRGLLALLAGAGVAMVLIGGVEIASAGLYPPPQDLDPGDQEQMAAFVASLPTGAFLMILAAWTAGAIGGGFTAARLASCCRPLHAGIIGLLLIAGALATMRQIPHPGWMWAAGPLVITAGTCLGSFVAAWADAKARPKQVV